MRAQARSGHRAPCGDGAARAGARMAPQRCDAWAGPAAGLQPPPAYLGTHARAHGHAEARIATNMSSILRGMSVPGGAGHHLGRGGGDTRLMPSEKVKRALDESGRPSSPHRSAQKRPCPPHPHPLLTAVRRHVGLQAAPTPLGTTLCLQHLIGKRSVSAEGICSRLILTPAARRGSAEALFERKFF